MPKYPILVERLKGDRALRLVCYDGCGWETDITPEQMRNEQDYGCPECRGHAGFKYEEADFKCPSCGKLHFDRLPYPDGVCSRVCHHQNEYAKTLVR
jgi:hypothetical protein